MLARDPKRTETMDDQKPQLKGLFRDQPETPEGKYCVLRRDGTPEEWPSFVLGARDPIAEFALRAYGREVIYLCQNEPAMAKELNITEEFGRACIEEADRWSEYRKLHGKGDPGSGRHRKDDPATIALMRKARSA